MSLPNSKAPNRRGPIAFAAALALLGLAASHQPAAAAKAARAAAPIDLSGFWEVSDELKHASPADLTPDFLATQKSSGGQQKYNDLVLQASRWCHPLGTPFIMGDSAPLDLIQSKNELAITAEVQSAARHIYLDGRKHPPADEFDATTNGHSTGHWEGKTLVVDTVGFNQVGNLMIPGGGLRGPKSHLVERYQLRNGGKDLNVQFTWTDPTVFAKPHTYDFTYHRARPGEFAHEYFCDASNPARGESVAVNPPGK